MRRGLIALALLCVAAGSASAQSIQLSAQTRDIYAELPFIVLAQVEGFDESPQPKIKGLEIEGADVELIDVSPSIQQSITVINGRRTEKRLVSFRYAFRVTVHKPGSYQIPSVTVTQGDNSASTDPTGFRAGAVSTTDDMRLSAEIPERPVWVGETFELTLDWYLRRDPKQPSFSIPLFDSDQVEVNPPRDGKGDGTLEFNAGSRQIELPYTRSTETLGGSSYTRFRFRAMVTPMRPGKLEMPAAKVVSNLVVASGFRRRSLGTYKAEDRPRSLEIRPLPLKDRPDSFANAVGSAFSMEVQASRTVVRVGDPVELTVRIRGDGPLEGVSLPDLTADGGLSPAQFDIPEDQAPGTIEAGGGKTFAVTVRLESAEAREIPALAFSYFDPETSKYKTVRSQPIALSVAGSAVVGAGDVVGAPRTEPGPDEDGAAAGGGPVSLVGADLALSAPGDTLDEPMSTSSLLWLLIALYGAGAVVFCVRLWGVRTRERRAETGHLRKLRREVRSQLDAAVKQPGVDAAPKLVAALKALGKATGRKPPADIIEELETQTYNPTSAKEPLSAALRERIERASDDMARADRTPGAAGATSAAAALVIALSATAYAAQADMDAARTAYKTALEDNDRDTRTRGFAQAELAFRELVAQHPGRPELLADWGNAALGAQDIGRATLAYRRALYHDGSLRRARKNLSWVRKRAPSWLATPENKGAIDSLFFWHHALTPAQRHLAAALGFCAFMLLITPWGRRTRLLRRLSLLPVAVFIAMVVSLGLERDQSSDVVVVADGVVLRSADSVGAPPALANPLPAGAEAEQIETRGSWTRLSLADGTRGWVHAGVVERVVAAE